MRVDDGRTTPFIWATVGALRVIREGVEAERQKPVPGRKPPRLPAVLATYVALITVANEGHKRPMVGGDSAEFGAVTDRLAELSGNDTRTVTAAVRVLEKLGLVRVERRRNAAGGRNLPNRYELKEPANQDGDRPPCPANQDGLSPPCPANQDGDRPSLQKKEHLRRRGERSNSGKSSGSYGDAWDRFLSGRTPDSDFEPDDLGASVRERVQGAVS